jgi:SAM-dependent methyltransferase
MYDSLLSEEGLTHSKKIIQDDMLIAGLLDRIGSMDIMDVGTGRQALSMGLLGAGKVDHYDISKPHVKRFCGLLKEKYSKLPITTTNLDLCLDKLPANKYDLVYLAGIVHHFSNPAAGLKNCAQAVKPGGMIWLYFYRSGTFKWFVTEMIRRLLSSNDLDKYFYSTAMLFSSGNISNPITSQIMDDFFAPYIYLFPPESYLRFMNSLGFELCSTSHADPLTSCNHDLCHHSAVLVFKRTKELNIESVDTGLLLNPENEVDQLNPEMYTNKTTHKIIEVFHKVKVLLDQKDDEALRYSLCLAMHKNGAPQYYNEKALPPRRQETFDLLTNALTYLESR